MKPDIEAFVRLAFDAQLPLTAMNARVEEIQVSAVTLSAPITDVLTTKGTGLVMGGVLGLIGDVAAGLSVIAGMDAPRPVTTTSMNLYLLAPARGARIIATGRILKPGARIAAAGADLFVERDGARIAVAALQAGFAVGP
jgi:acyl-coenzyme A thioesterase PaaI-like protein